MRRKYLLFDTEFWIEIVAVKDLEIHPFYATQTTATALAKFIRANYLTEITITSTLPNVYIHARNTLFFLPYRPFLSFVTSLHEIEEFVKLNWLTDGF